MVKLLTDFASPSLPVSCGFVTESVVEAVLPFDIVSEAGDVHLKRRSNQMTT